MKSLKDAFLLFKGNTRTRVADLHADDIAELMGRKFNLSTLQG